MTTLQTVQEIAKSGAEILGAISAFATLVAHLPLPWPRLSAFFARVGVATSKFAVAEKAQP